MAIRIRTSSRGLDPGRLVPGEDLVLEIDVAHGEELADGVGVRDHLSGGQRHEADRLAGDLLERWRDECDAPLTIQGVCWPFVLELDLLLLFGPAVADAIGLEQALMSYEERTVVLADDDARTAALVGAVAARHRIEVRRDCAPTRHARDRHRAARRAPPLQRMRRATVRSVTTMLGAPSVLRDGSIVLACYWPMMPLFDALLSAGDRRPAVMLDALPTGPARSLRAAVQGGWVGRPGPSRRASARRPAAAAVRDARAIEVSLDAGGLALGAYLHPAALEVVHAGLARRLATVATIREAFASGRVRQVVVSYDLDPGGRLVTLLAREADIPTLLVQHGAYFLPCVRPDMTVADKAAIWSEYVVHQSTPDRRLHPIGYPLLDAPRPDRRVRPPKVASRVVILPQPWYPTTAELDSRAWMRHCVIAIRSVRVALPAASTILRPHPSDPDALAAGLRKRFAGLNVDPTTDILELLAGCDLCIGGTTSAALQAALVDTPLLFLNVSGYEWRWPLGGQTVVPVARSEHELIDWIESWRRGVTVPGREQLLMALGADKPNPTGSLLRLLDGQLAEVSSQTAATWAGPESTSEAPALASARPRPRP